MYAVVQHLEGVGPGLVGEHVAEEAAAGPGQQTLVGELHLIEEYGLLARAPVDVAEDVQAGLDAPDLAEEVRAAEVEVLVVFLGG